MTRARLKIGDRVRIKAFFAGGKPGTMRGTVERYRATKHGSGGNRGYVRVAWDSGSVQPLCEERRLERVPMEDDNGEETNT